METVEIDFDANYTVDGYRGVIFYPRAWGTRTVQEDAEVWCAQEYTSSTDTNRRAIR